MPGEEDVLEKKKGHRERRAGRKAEKKKAKNPHVQELTDKQRNPKAFAINSAVRAERRFRRKQDLETKKHHIPLVDRTPLEPPPVIVAVVGPPKVGKTTLIQCIIRAFNRQTLTTVRGPVTLVAGKKRRITIIECNNDINSMIDIAKVADLVLLLIDASFGFEMEVFEFLNICQVHGMPRVMGVLTHLDTIKAGKQLKKTKKSLKHRFWTEVFQGAKLFFLSGMHHEEYMRHEVKNLCRFIMVMKFRPLTWRTSHPYILADRLEDLTPPELVRQNPKVDRLVSFYGYVRGIALNKTCSIHIPGCGDLKIHDVSHIPDPCPLPETLKKRSLLDTEKLVYAPFSGVGGIVYDKDAVYLELGGSHSHAFEDDEVKPEKTLVNTLLETQETLDMKMAKSELQLFSGTAPIISADVTENNLGLTEELVNDSGRIRRKVVFPQDSAGGGKLKNESESDDSDDEFNAGDDELSGDSDTEDKSFLYANRSSVKNFSTNDDSENDNLDKEMEKMKKLKTKTKYERAEIEEDTGCDEIEENLGIGVEKKKKKRKTKEIENDDSINMDINDEEMIVKKKKKKKKKKMKNEVEDDADTDSEAEEKSEVTKEKKKKKKKHEKIIDSMEEWDTAEKMEVDEINYKKIKIKEENIEDDLENNEIRMKKNKKKRHSKEKRRSSFELKVEMKTEESEGDGENEQTPRDSRSRDKRNTSEMLNGETKEKMKKRKSAISEAERRLLNIMAEDSDKFGHVEEEADNVEEEIPIKKRKLGEDKVEETKPVRYRDIGSEKDRAIHSKISGLLTELQSNKERKPRNEDDIDSEFSCGEDSDTDTDVKSDKLKHRPAFELNQFSSAEDSSGDEMELESDYADAPDTKSVVVKEESEGEGQDESAVRWKADLAQKAADAFLERQANTQNLWKLVYGNLKHKIGAKEEDEKSDHENEDVGGLFRVAKRRQQEMQEEKDLMNADDSTKFEVKQVRDWTVTDVCELIRDCFVTGKWKESEDAAELLRLDASDDELFGDFEDLETGEKHASKTENEGKTANKAEGTGKEIKKMTKEELQEKKRKLKEKFDAEYDDEKEGGPSYYDELKLEMDQQAKLNKNEFEGLDDSIRIQLEGYRPGLYVRVEVDKVPCELVQHFDPTYPLILGGLHSGEENIGYVQVRIRKHRWYKKILKNEDPLIISLGWRRFQTLPVFSKLEDNMRLRRLKYTPEHVTIMANFWGPITPQSTGFLAVQDVASRQMDFRIAATGSVVELDKSTQIMKKLKLTGTPYKIYKKTAFIKDMFNSVVEVAKFEGARVKTVSGIRGQIKKAVSKPPGAFRATFEDRILMSDIVFCRTWYKVEVPKFYNPVTSLLLPPEQKNQWRGMKTVGQLKREKGIRFPAALDSLYTPVERIERVFKPLVIPKTLEKALPYKYKPRHPPPEEKKKVIESGRIAVIREPHEQEVASVMKILKTTYNHKQQQLKMEKKQKMKEFLKQKEEENFAKIKRQKQLRKQVFRTLSKMETNKKGKDGKQPDWKVGNRKGFLFKK